MPELLRAKQAYFDKYHFDPGKVGYNRLGRADAKVAHIGWHVAKIVGSKLPEWFERRDERLMTGVVIPDLATYGTQLANTLHMDDEAFVGFDHVHSVEAADRQIRSALGDIAAYIEPLEHDLPARPHLPRQAAVKLWGAAVDLAIEFNIPNLAQAHQSRLEEHMQAPFPAQMT